MLLSIESSASAASAALFADGRLIAECFLDIGLIHSRTLMPLVESLLRMAGKKANELSHIAVAQGPGSFTGLRIGMAGAMGMAEALQIPCIGISTLEGCARQLAVQDGILCPVLDARRGQVYNALFSAGGGAFERITEDRMLSIEELALEIESFSNKLVFLVGDGAELCYNSLIQHSFVRLAPAHMRQQRASGTALAAISRLAEPGFVPPPAAPVYLRLCQAERELRQRLNAKTYQKDE